MAYRTQQLISLILTAVFIALVAADGGCPDSDKCLAACKKANPNLDIVGGLCAGSQNKKCYCLERVRRRPGDQVVSTTTQSTTYSTNKFPLGEGSTTQDGPETASTTEGATLPTTSSSNPSTAPTAPQSPTTQHPSTASEPSNEGTTWSGFDTTSDSSSVRTTWPWRAVTTSSAPYSNRPDSSTMPSTTDGCICTC